MRAHSGVKNAHTNTQRFGNTVKLIMISFGTAVELLNSRITHV